MRPILISLLLALAGCHQSVEVRASGRVDVRGGEPVEWVARYQAGG
jgi:hypothetical protein